jgi:hypothetical protein
VRQATTYLRYDVTAGAVGDDVDGRGAGVNDWRPRRSGAAGSYDLTHGNGAAVHVHVVRV